jgi:hypothetical protein
LKRNSSSVAKYSPHSIFAKLSLQTGATGRADQRDRLLLACGWTKAKAQPHTAEPKGRHFQITLAKFALLHFASYHY